MKKALIIGGVCLGAVVLAKRLAPSRGEFNFEKMLERMPDSAPPKWMFLNITAIRENTERILERLDKERETVSVPSDEREGIVV